MRTHGHWDKGVIVHKNTDTYIYLKTRKLEYWCLTTLEYLEYIAYTDIKNLANVLTLLLILLLLRL